MQSVAEKRKAQSESGKTPEQTAGGAWSDLLEQRVTPLAPPGTAGAGILLLLLVLARALTPLAADPRFVSLPTWRPNAQFAAGLVLVVVAIAVPIAAVTGAPTSISWGVLTVGGAAIAVAAFASLGKVDTLSPAFRINRSA